MTQELPPLPETEWLLHMPARPYESEWTSHEEGYTADQMRAYALQAIAARADAQPVAPALPERWVIVRQTALDVGFADDVRTGGRPELGYSLIADAATFDSKDAARAALREVGLPLGWVLLPLSQLLPDLYAAPAPRQPLSEEQVFASQDLMHLNGMMLRLSMTNLMQVVRAIERAHGITEDTCPKT